MAQPQLSFMLELVPEPPSPFELMAARLREERMSEGCRVDMLREHLHRLNEWRDQNPKERTMSETTRTEHGANR